MTIEELRAAIDQLCKQFPSKAISLVTVEGFELDQLDIEGSEVSIRSSVVAQLEKEIEGLKADLEEARADVEDLQEDLRSCQRDWPRRIRASELAP